MESPYPVVAAIDFGTHSTGYAWIEVVTGNREASQRKPYCRYEWPGTSSRYPKTLTALLLDAAGEAVAFGYEALEEWNDRAARDEHDGYTYVSNFKMALRPDPYQGMTPPGRGVQTIDRPDKAYPLVTEYLRWMYGIALADIRKSGYLEDQIRWCVTVPAIWDEPQKQGMRRAAVAAGLPDDPDRLLLAIEPEVAALHCQIHLARPLGSQEHLDITQNGRRFTVVDCGGGTVDITSYRVDRSAGGRPRLIEIAQPAGAKLGSEYINKAFEEQILERWFGGRSAVTRIRENCPHAFGEMLDRWEVHKLTAAARRGPDGDPVFDRAFRPVIPGEILAELDDDARRRLAEAGPAQRIVVKPEEVRDLFDSVVLSIVEHVQDQLEEVRRRDGAPTEPERLLLVGGLGRSEYLHLRLQQAFGDKAVLIAPTQPEGAVLFGAVHFGYDPSTIRSRLARYTYGTEIMSEFRPGIDPPAKKRIEDGVEYCTSRFRVFVTEGEPVEYDQVINQDFVPITEDQTNLVLQFYRTLQPKPQYVDEPGCEALVAITIDLGEAMERPRAERSVRARFRFGRTQIEVTAVNIHTDEEQQCELQFHATY